MEYERIDYRTIGVNGLAAAYNIKHKTLLKPGSQYDTGIDSISTPA